jgi:hypothetical protein
VNPFQPKRDDGRSLARVALEYLVQEIESGALKPGQIIRHEVLAGEMEADYPSSSYFQAIPKVTRNLQAQFHLSLVSVRGAGYQLIEGMAMVDKSRSEHGRARKQISKAVATVEAVDEGVLATAGERDVLVQVRRGFAVIASVIDQQAEAIAQHDEEIKHLKNARVDDRSRISAIEAQIRALSEKLQS